MARAEKARISRETRTSSPIASFKVRTFQKESNTYNTHYYQYLNERSAFVVRDTSQTLGRNDRARFEEAQRGAVSGEVRGKSFSVPFLFSRKRDGATVFIDIVLFLYHSQESFYRDSAAAGTCTALAYARGEGDDEDENAFNELAGAIAVRLEKHPKLPDKARMYIMTLGVYAPHRARGIGSRLLMNSLNEASEDENIVDAYLHVQTNNEEAIKFYCDPTGKFAFEKGEVIEKYYKRIEPDSAVVLRLEMKKWKRKELENARYMEYHA